MSQNVISDNWSLQDVSNLLIKGVDSSVANLVTPSSSTDSHNYDEIPLAIVALEALFDLITDVVLRNQILVEEKYIDAWFNKNGPLDKLREQSVVRPFAFDPTIFASLRDEFFVGKLCSTTSLRKAHQENVDGWNKSRRSPHRLLSQTIWGGAGMLARAYAYEQGYTPHPIRKRLFQEAGLALADTDAVLRACNTISEKRAAIRALQSSGHELYSLQVKMDPLPIKVLRECSSLSAIPTVALQVRDEYVELRNWLGQFQESIHSGDYKEIQKHQKLLTSISRYVDAVMGKTDPDTPTFTAGIDILKVAFKAGPLNALQNRRGARSMINKLILDASGTAELKKLLRLLGHQDSEIGMKVLTHFSSRERA